MEVLSEYSWIHADIKCTIMVLLPHPQPFINLGPSQPKLSPKTGHRGYQGLKNGSFVILMKENKTWSL
jgi:hypothetical protein